MEVFIPIPSSTSIFNCCVDQNNNKFNLKPLNYEILHINKFKDKIDELKTLAYSGGLGFDLETSGVSFAKHYEYKLYIDKENYIQLRESYDFQIENKSVNIKNIKVGDEIFNKYVIQNIKKVLVSDIYITGFSLCHINKQYFFYFSKFIHVRGKEIKENKEYIIKFLRENCKNLWTFNNNFENNAIYEIFGEFIYFQDVRVFAYMQRFTWLLLEKIL